MALGVLSASVPFGFVPFPRGCLCLFLPLPPPHTAVPHIAPEGTGGTPELPLVTTEHIRTEGRDMLNNDQRRQEAN